LNVFIFSTYGLGWSGFLTVAHGNDPDRDQPARDCERLTEMLFIDHEGERTALSASTHFPSATSSRNGPRCKEHQSTFSNLDVTLDVCALSHR
jgi:hypothetical protein